MSSCTSHHHLRIALYVFSVDRYDYVNAATFLFFVFVCFPHSCGLVSAGLDFLHVCWRHIGGNRHHHPSPRNGSLILGNVSFCILFLHPESNIRLFMASTWWGWSEAKKYYAKKYFTAAAYFTRAGDTFHLAPRHHVWMPSVSIFMIVSFPSTAARCEDV